MHRTMLRANREANGSRHRRLKRGTTAILAEAEKMMNFQPSAKGSKLAKSAEGLSEPSTTVSVMIPKSGKGTTEIMPELLMSMPMALGKSGKMGKADAKAAKAMMPAMSMSMLMPMMAGKSGKMSKGMMSIETPVTTVEPDAAESTSQMSSSTSSANTKSSSLTVLPFSPEPEKTQPTPLSMAAQAAASLQHTDSHQPTVSWPTWSPALTAWPTYFPTSSPNSQ